MRVINGVTWVGNCTDKFDETVAFFRDVMGLEVARTGVPVVDTQYARYAVFELPGGVMFEVFEPKNDIAGRFNGPVLSFTVDDLEEACRELETQGAEFVTPILDDSKTWRWRYFRAPDGNIYLAQEHHKQQG